MVLETIGLLSIGLVRFHGLRIQWRVPAQFRIGRGGKKLNRYVPEKLRESAKTSGQT